jgi:hypothetical protein
MEYNWRDENDYSQRNRLQENSRKHHGLYGCSHERLWQRLQLSLQANQCYRCECAFDLSGNVWLQLHLWLQLQCASSTELFF